MIHILEKSGYIRSCLNGKIEHGQIQVEDTMHLGFRSSHYRPDFSGGLCHSLFVLFPINVDCNLALVLGQFHSSSPQNKEKGGDRQLSQCFLI